MKFNTYEIEILIRIYNKVIHEKDSTDKIESNFIKYTILTVEKWLEILYEDEKEILKLRYFNQKSCDHIAGYLGYKNHSSVVKKLATTLKKIESTFYM